ncbi:MAG: agmatinase [Candidatus Verstraetearchaeota archaeon]|nr:agmatinase [Candidatus Verstraetearchaeota archaeon]
MKGAFYVDDPSRGFGGFKRDFSEADFVLFGVPFDSTSSYRPGSRFGPTALREVSANLETWSWRTGVDFEEVKLHDMGDLAVVHGDSAETIRRVAETVEDIVSSRKVPVMVGGEHMMTLGAVKAFKDVTVVSFDAHFDMRDEYLSNRLSHACVMRRIAEELGAGKVVLMGARGTYREEMDFVKKSGINYLSSFEIMRSVAKAASSWLHERLRDCKKVYISIDIDVLDPAYAPGVGNSEPEGISPTVLLDVLNEVVDDRVVGFDLMEVSPQYDNGSTATVASKIIFEICSMITASRR